MNIPAWLPLVLCCTLGGSIRMLMILNDLAKQGDSISPLGWIKRYPYSFGLSVTGSAAAMILLAESGQITMATALLAGWVSEDITDTLAKRTERYMS